MCQVVSVAVHPTTCEVFALDGSWSHHEICSKHGIEPDKVFKPEISLRTRVIELPELEQRIAFTRKLPPELVLQILSEYKQSEEVNGGQLEDLQISGVMLWGPNHKKAVSKWAIEKIGDARKLMEYSCKTFEPHYFKETVKKGAIRDISLLGMPLERRQPGGIYHKIWLADFQKVENRVEAWR